MNDEVLVLAREPWVPGHLIDVTWRQYDWQRKQWRAWEHNPDCSSCDGLGHYGAPRRVGYDPNGGVSCPCGGWADEIDQWASAEVATLIRRRRQIFADRRAAG
jgi:hypothetical protein